MTEPEPRPTQSIWGINPDDRSWFTALTSIGGTSLAGTIMGTMIANRPTDDTIDQLLLRMAVTVTTAYPAAGFLSWMILSTKDLMMSFADDMRKRTARKIAGYREEGRDEGRDEGRRQALDELAGIAQAEGNQELRDLLTRLKDRGPENRHAD